MTDFPAGELRPIRAQQIADEIFGTPAPGRTILLATPEGPLLDDGWRRVPARLGSEEEFRRQCRAMVDGAVQVQVAFPGWK